MSSNTWTMMILTLLLSVSIPGTVGATASVDCISAEHGCVQDPACVDAYRVLEYCTAEEAVAMLGPDSQKECLEAQRTLQSYRPLQVCKCHRGSRQEERCLKVYWTVRFSVYDEYTVSPYEELELLRIKEMNRLAPIMEASSLALVRQNQCLKAAQECGGFEKCGSLRSEYVVACTKHTPGSDGTCNRQKCHRALRRFLERVPEEYVFALLFCPCSDMLCGERRRKTIVPSCSHEERGEKPNCMSLQGYCIRDELCRSRLADFQHNCQPSTSSPSGCVRENIAVCLKAYSGLIGTIMTPNYVSNSSMEVSQWCTCEGSGNQWKSCLQVLLMFSSNRCLKNAIENTVSSFSSLLPWPVESTAIPTPRSSSPVLQEKTSVSLNILPELKTVKGEDKEKRSEELNAIPAYTQKESSTGPEAWVGQRESGSSVSPQSILLLLLCAASRCLYEE
ncbi:GDNF family receptor alpha-4-like [Denticeps clupeoides]|uniref:GDNF/GAS1 domain-containing protein n=1 Tax=Denticeps clupeoides TaxID=299321 RepID=A0AAY4DFY5_9TELE|nr:GDNF family receptor alpha-4-like [Denticeps clupeoides]